MFAYCWNNPIAHSDAAGTNPLEQAMADDSTPWDDHENLSRLPSGGGGSGRTGSGSGSTSVQADTSSTLKTVVAGGPHGCSEHYSAIKAKIESLLKNSLVKKIWGNCKLRTAGLLGNQKPDIIYLQNDGTYEVWEFASPSQATGTKGYFVLLEKIDIMQTANPDVRFRFIPWEEIR